MDRARVFRLATVPLRLVRKALTAMVSPPRALGMLLLPRTRYDYARDVGDGLGSSVVVAPVLWAARAFPEAPLVLWRRLPDGELERVGEHPLLDVVEYPNPFYSGPLLWMATVVDYMVRTFTRVVEGMRVYPERMEANVYAGGGLAFSERVLLALVDRGMSREEAYQVIQELALRALDTGASFRALVEADPRVGRVLDASGVARCFDLGPFLARVDYIFGRLGLLPDESSQASGDAARRGGAG